MNNLVAGRDLDARVAEKVMGLFVYTVNDQPCYSPYSEKTHITNDVILSVPEYSTSIAAAWEVVTHLRSQGYSLELNLWPEGDCTVIVHRMDVGAAEINQTDVPLAICWAALKVAGVEA